MKNASKCKIHWQTHFASKTLKWRGKQEEDLSEKIQIVRIEQKVERN